MGDPGGVAAQYAAGMLLTRIDEALTQADLDGSHLDWRNLTPLNHFHSRGVAATSELAALAPGRGDHVLDVGCRVGSSARFRTATYGCRATGVDITPAAVGASRAGRADASPCRRRTRFAVP